MIRLSYLIALFITSLFTNTALGQNKSSFNFKEIEQVTEEAIESVRSVLRSTNVTEDLFFEKSSSLSLSKSFDQETKSNTSLFNVDNKTRKIRFNMSGECNDGIIKLVIKLPNDTIFKTIKIDNNANISWTHTLILKGMLEEKKNKYFGDWKLNVATTNASGRYHFSISTY